MVWSLLGKCAPFGLALFAFGLPIPVAGTGGDVIAGPVGADVVRVIDGDTLEVRARIWLGQEIQTKVRLLGLDAPERRGRCGEERAQAAAARALVLDSVSAGPVQLFDLSFGKYAGRVTARVETADGRDVGRLLLERGLALPYAGGKRHSWCASLSE